MPNSSLPQGEGRDSLSGVGLRGQGVVQQQDEWEKGMILGEGGVQAGRPERCRYK
jgi:hypothetical protein